MGAGWRASSWIPAVRLRFLVAHAPRTHFGARASLSANVPSVEIQDVATPRENRQQKEKTRVPESAVTERAEAAGIHESESSRDGGPNGQQRVARRHGLLSLCVPD